MNTIERFLKLCHHYDLFPGDHSPTHKDLNVLDNRANIDTTGGLRTRYWGPCPVNAVGTRIALLEEAVANAKYFFWLGDKA